MFNDVFKLYESGGLSLEIDKSDIAWESDMKYKYKNIKEIPEGLKNGNKVVKDWRDIQWMDMTDPDFIVWMRTSGLPTFRKLYVTLNDGLKKGKYTVRIDNKFNVEPFHGKKSIVFSTANTWGGKNHTLANAFIILGLFCIGFDVLFLFMLKKRKQD